MLKITDRIPWEETLAQEQHHRELFKKANRRRSIRQTPERETTSYQLLLVRLGERLVKWGCRLQARYGTLTQVSESILYTKALYQQLSTADTGIG